VKTIQIVDLTLRENAARSDVQMSFKEKLEVAKQMDKLKVDVVELPPLGEAASDSLLARSIATTLKNSVAFTNHVSAHFFPNCPLIIAIAILRPYMTAHTISPLTLIQKPCLLSKRTGHANTDQSSGFFSSFRG